MLDLLLTVCFRLRALCLNMAENKCSGSYIVLNFVAKQVANSRDLEQRGILSGEVLQAQVIRAAASLFNGDKT